MRLCTSSHSSLLRSSHMFAPSLLKPAVSGVERRRFSQHTPSDEMAAMVAVTVTGADAVVSMTCLEGGRGGGGRVAAFRLFDRAVMAGLSSPKAVPVDRPDTPHTTP